MSTCGWFQKFTLLIHRGRIMEGRLNVLTANFIAMFRDLALHGCKSGMFSCSVLLRYTADEALVIGTSQTIYRRSHSILNVSTFLQYQRWLASELTIARLYPSFLSLCNPPSYRPSSQIRPKAGAPSCYSSSQG